MGLDERKPVLGGCEQQRHRPASASAQTDQRLCYSLIEKNNIQICYKRNLTFLSMLVSVAEETGLSNTKDRFCRDEAHYGFG